MNRLPKSLGLSAIVFLLTTHPLPAPIHEQPEKKATPSPAPKPAQKPKSTTKTKPAAKAESQAATPAKRSRFAGTWVGTMATMPFGNLHTVLTVDSTETAMAVSWYDAADTGVTKTHEKFKPAAGNAAVKPAFAKAKLNGDTLTASFPAPLLGTSTWSITPQSNGVTARVRMQAALNDFTATFDRTAGASGTAPSTR
jgi:hypothetical protein